MGTQTLVGNDTITISGVVGGNDVNNTFTNVPHGDIGVLTFPNELVTVKIGKNQNAIFAKNAQGDEADFVLRVLKGSYDDKFLDALINAQNNDFPSFQTLTATLTKRLGGGNNGTIVNDKYILQGGIFSKRVEAKENIDGDVEQAVSVYSMKFTIPGRTIM